LRASESSIHEKKVDGDENTFVSQVGLVVCCMRGVCLHLPGPARQRVVPEARRI
jgi:hypothetical protein